MSPAPKRLPPPRRRRRMGGSAARPVLVVVVVVVLIAVAALWAMSRLPADPPAPTTPGASVAANMGPLEPGTNRQGRDLSDFGTRTVDARECANRCYITAACKAMTFARTGEREGMCWLKSAAPEPSPNPDLTSAVKLEAAAP